MLAINRLVDSFIDLSKHANPQKDIKEACKESR